MSASSKKKLRKEQNMAALTEKQLKEQSENKKLKRNTLIFTVIIAVVLLAALVIMGITAVNNSGIIDRNTVAAVVDGEEYNSVQFSFYYVDAINATYTDWTNSYGSNFTAYASLMGLDVNAPLDQQYYSAEQEVTWADYFLEDALLDMRRDVALCKLAEANGYTLDASGLSNVELAIAQYRSAANNANFADLDTYLRAAYGPGANEDTLREYLTQSTLASSYYSKYAEEIEITDEQIAAHSEEHYKEFSSYDYVSYYLSADYYLKGGTVGANGQTEYSDLDIAAALTAAREDADRLAALPSIEELDKAIADLAHNAESETPVASTKNTGVRFTDLESVVAQWVTDDARKEGDIAVLANTATTTDEDGNETSSVEGYYVVMFQKCNNNEDGLANVRHLLVAFNSETGSSTFTDQEKAAAKEEAEILLKKFKEGDATEESFIALVEAETDDTASAETGGLYENITPEEGVYVEPFMKWAVDESRKVGDVEIVETDYGYHIMYYVGDSETSYREYLINEQLSNDQLSAWYDETVESITYELGDTSRLNTSVVFGGSSAAETTPATDAA